MCGIVGILPRNDANSVEGVRPQLLAMRDAIAYRGPDDAGEFITGDIALGHRRLSILDVSSAGHQPMVTKDGSSAIVFNGEIYNFRELQEQYLADATLTSSSDTEVLLHLLQRQGLDILPKLRGMFSFAFWNGSRKELLLARDPFGKKPLYYVWQDDMFAFASEPKALFALNAVVKTPNTGAVAPYLLHEYVPSPLTAWQGIQQLGMGQAAVVTKHSIETRDWWKPTFLPKQVISWDKTLTTFDHLLGQAVERRMVADVPVGLFLSGGIDSTTILWYMKQAGAKDLHSVSVSFEKQSFDESSHIRLAADALKSQHHEMIFDVDTFKQVMPELAVRMDIPFADASLLPTYALSGLARKYMKVVLSGDGADELLGGYGTFTAAHVANTFSQLPSFVWTTLRTMGSLLPVSHEYFSFDFKAKSFLRGMGYPLVRRNQVWLGSFTERELEELLVPEYKSLVKDIFTAVDKIALETKGLPMFDALSYAMARHYLQDDILVKLDRATMFHSLEARTPFLDVDLAEFVGTLPVRYKQRKALVKAVMRGRIPDEIIDRPKKGFGIPLGDWFMGPLQGWLQETLSRERVERVGMWQWPYVERLLDEHIAGKADHRKKLWTLSMYVLWHEHWVLPH